MSYELLQAQLLSLRPAPPYERKNLLTTVTSHVRGLPACHGIEVSPSGRFPSDRDRPRGSIVSGMPAEANTHAIRLFTARCLAELPGARARRSE